jgi:hypothetical protein
MDRFPEDVLKAVAKEGEVRLTTYGRKTANGRRCRFDRCGRRNRVFIRSGKASAALPQTDERPEGELNLGRTLVRFKSKHVTDPAEARHSSSLYGPKYGTSVQASKEGEPLTLGEQAAFELLPPDS